MRKGITRAAFSLRPSRFKIRATISAPLTGCSPRYPFPTSCRSPTQKEPLGILQLIVYLLEHGPPIAVQTPCDVVEGLECFQGVKIHGLRVVDRELSQVPDFLELGNEQGDEPQFHGQFEDFRIGRLIQEVQKSLFASELCTSVFPFSSIFLLASQMSPDPKTALSDSPRPAP